MKTFKEAVKTCHVSACIYRRSNPDTVYWNNHPTPLEDRVPLSEQKYSDWCEHDPEAEFGHY